MTIFNELKTMFNTPFKRSIQIKLNRIFIDKDEEEFIQFTPKKLLVGASYIILGILIGLLMMVEI